MKEKINKFGTPLLALPGILALEEALRLSQVIMDFSGTRCGVGGMIFFSNITTSKTTEPPIDIGASQIFISCQLIVFQQ